LPLSVKERAKARRELVVEMLLRDCGRKEMREELGVGMDVVADDIGAIYKMHGLKGRRHGGRRELAERMGREWRKKSEIRIQNSEVDPLSPALSRGSAERG